MVNLPDRRFSFCLPMGIGLLFIAGYNYLVQGFTEHNVALLLAAAIVNFAYVFKKTMGGIVLALAALGFLVQGYVADGVFIVLLFAAIFGFDYFLDKAAKDKK